MLASAVWILRRSAFSAFCFSLTAPAYNLGHGKNLKRCIAPPRWILLGCSLLYMVTSLGGPVGDVSRRAWNRNRCVYLHNWGLFVYFACFVFVFPACPAVLHSLRIQQSQSQTQAHLPQGWGSFRHAPWRLRSGPASYHSSSSSSPSPEQTHSLIGLALYEI